MYMGFAQTRSFNHSFIRSNRFPTIPSSPGDCDGANNSEECQYDGGDVSVDLIHTSYGFSSFWAGVKGQGAGFYSDTWPLVVTTPVCLVLRFSISIGRNRYICTPVCRVGRYGIKSIFQLRL